MAITRNPQNTICCLNPDCQNPKNPDQANFCLRCGTRLVQRLRGRYRIIEPLGGGGFGRTYLAEDVDKLNERCVVKQLVPQVQGSWALQKATELFEEEAKRLQQLGKHPQIPTLYAYFQEGNYLYLVQELVEGQNLLAELEQQGAFSEPKIWSLLKDLLPILQFIHEQEVIHWDIKPENIIRRQSDGKLVLIDFGSAKQVAATVTASGTTIGSYGYAPIEQMQCGEAYPASDLYSLGATCFHLLTNTSPWLLWQEHSYSWVQGWQQHLICPTSQKLEQMLSKLLQIHWQQRYQSVSEVLENLNQNQQPIRTLLSTLPLPRWLKVTLVGGGILAIGSLTAVIPKPWDRLPQLPKSYFTRGEESLINQYTSSGKSLCQQAFDKKEQGMQAFANDNFSLAKENFQAAINLFKQAHLKCSIDPETQIFLNNAKANIQGNPLTIAVVVPINGSEQFSKVAEQMLRGVAHVQDTLAQTKGIQGRLLQVIIVRDDNQAEVGKRVAGHLGKNNIPGDTNFRGEVLGVVGHYTSNVTLATGEVYEKERLVAVSPTSTAVRQSNASPSGYKFNLSKYVFRTASPDSVAADDLFKYMRTIPGSGQVAVFFNSQEIYSLSLKEVFEKKVAKNTISCDLSQFNVNTCIDRAKNAKFWMLGLDTGKATEVLLAIERNQSKLPLLGGDALYSEDKLPSDFGDKSKNMVLAVTSHIELFSKSFKEESIRLWGTQHVGWRTATAYDAAEAIVEGLRRNPTRTGLYNALSDPNFSAKGATAKVLFDKLHDRQIAPQDDRKLGVLVKVQQQCKPNDDKKYRFCLLKQ